MGIKTYDVEETKALLEKNGFTVLESERSLIYVKGKILMVQEALGGYEIYTEDVKKGVSKVYSSTDENKACRFILSHLGVKTVNHSSRK